MITTMDDLGGNEARRKLHGFVNRGRIGGFNGTQGLSVLSKSL